MLTYILAFIISCALVAAGYIWGKESSKLAPTGSIVLDKNDEGTDRIIFNLGMEYDDLADHKYIIFEVVKKMKKI